MTGTAAPRSARVRTVILVITYLLYGVVALAAIVALAAVLLAVFQALFLFFLR
ncbi:hypothetical protein GCM10027294_37890 [Marinactinospora endophytica]